MAHLGAPFLLSGGSFWIVAIGNCWFLPIRFVALVTAWFVAFGNCWFVAYGNWRLLCLILRIQFPRVFLTPQTFTFKEIVRVLIILSNSYIHTLSSPQKMRANGTVVTEILHFENIMLNTGIGFSHVITKTTLIRITIFYRKNISVISILRLHRA